MSHGDIEEKWLNPFGRHVETEFLWPTCQTPGLKLTEGTSDITAQKIAKSSHASKVHHLPWEIDCDLYVNWISIHVFMFQNITTHLRRLQPAKRSAFHILLLGALFGFFSYFWQIWGTSLKAWARRAHLSMLVNPSFSLTAIKAWNVTSPGSAKKKYTKICGNRQPATLDLHASPWIRKENILQLDPEKNGAAHVSPLLHLNHPLLHRRATWSCPICWTGIQRNHQRARLVERKNGT